MARGTEVLAPAGNMEMLQAAVLAGADAVYLGLERFNARRTAGNFTIDALGQAVVFCHARNVRVHVTLNTIVYPGELPAMAQAIYDVAAAGVDAVIVQDLAVARLVRTMAPGLALHASTQMSVHSLAGALRLAELGFSRVILSRELSLLEIAHIAAHCGIETEVFVHGALCMSVSGQCYMSAFLGGRSGNRGGCAGPCRLPFEADAPQNVPGMLAGAHHLSLKDMSHIARLPELVQAGVTSVKIEGRLRTPEYAAAAVNACRQTLDGAAYDAELLQDVFSRSGFTNSYLDGAIDRNMFGVHTEENTSAARAAAPRLRELFRREMPRVRVAFAAHLEAEGAKLTATDTDGNRAIVYSDATELQPAQKDQTENIQKALAKTGGTPFYVTEPAQVDDGAWFLPASEWNEMRRKALDGLLLQREKLVPHACLPVSDAAVQGLLALSESAVPPQNAQVFTPQAAAAPGALGAQAARGGKRLMVQFENMTQMPEAWRNGLGGDTGRAGETGRAEEQGKSSPNGLRAGALSRALPDAIVLPLAQWRQVPEALRPRVWLALPRWLAGAHGEEAAAQLVRESADKQAFAGYFVQNLAHIELCKGLPMFGGFGLNVTNAISAQTYTAMGLCGVTLSPELLASDMAQIAAGETAVLAYGHMPLMLTRACPLHNARGCNGCSGAGTLLDRKGKYFPVHCTAPAAAGVRTVYNPIPLYMGDKLRELPVSVALVQFTVETTEQAAQVLAAVQAQKPFTGEFTRGLYFKGTQ